MKSSELNRNWNSKANNNDYVQAKVIWFLICDCFLLLFFFLTQQCEQHKLHRIWSFQFFNFDWATFICGPKPEHVSDSCCVNSCGFPLSTLTSLLRHYSSISAAADRAKCGGSQAASGRQEVANLFFVAVRQQHACWRCGVHDGVLFTLMSDTGRVQRCQQSRQKIRVNSSAVWTKKAGQGAFWLHLFLLRKEMLAAGALLSPHGKKKTHFREAFGKLFLNWYQEQKTFTCWFHNNIQGATMADYEHRLNFDFALLTLALRGGVVSTSGHHQNVIAMPTWVNCLSLQSDIKMLIPCIHG